MPGRGSVTKRKEARGGFIVAEGPEGVRFRVHARPGAGADRVVTVDPWRQALVVQVAARAEGGKANTRLLQVLEVALGVKAAQMEIEHGHTSREKVVFVRGLSAADVEAALGGAK